MKNVCEILDCTIRDGSYSIKYQFTAEDTYLISACLCHAGISRIEVGHGLGLDAQYKGKGSAAESDIRYIEAGKAAVNQKAKIGVFFIPGIGELDGIRKAADAGLDFIRIGTNVDQYEKARKPIEVAKQLGLEVWSNLMKSYVVDAELFGRTCREVAEFGSDIVVLVDSAGGMTPNMVKAYTIEALSRVDVPLGFHGHNNLMLVHANCLAFVETGGRLIDSSLRGLGRSAGNAATELISALLCREGYEIGEVDWEQLMILSEKLVKPQINRDMGLLPVEIATGLNLFHSGFEKVVDKASKEFNVSTFRTILNLEESARSTVTDQSARQAAMKAKSSAKQGGIQPALDFRWLQRVGCKTLPELKAELQTLSAKSGFPVVITMSRPNSAATTTMRLAPIRFGNGFCIGHIEVAAGYEEKVCNFFRGEHYYWMVDGAITKPDHFKSDKWLNYDDDQLMIEAIADIIMCKYPDANVYIPNTGERIVYMAHLLLNAVEETPWEIGVALSRTHPFTPDDVNKIAGSGVLILAYSKAITKEGLFAAHQKNLQIWRPDLSIGLIAEVFRRFENHQRIKLDAGQNRIKDIQVVAGGIIGKSGDIVVNSISRPTQIWGKADGYGGLKPLSDRDERQKEAVIKWMLERMSNSILCQQ